MALIYIYSVVEERNEASINMRSSKSQYSGIHMLPGNSVKLVLSISPNPTLPTMSIQEPGLLANIAATYCYWKLEVSLIHSNRMGCGEERERKKKSNMGFIRQ